MCSRGAQGNPAISVTVVPSRDSRVSKKGPQLNCFMATIQGHHVSQAPGRNRPSAGRGPGKKEGGVLRGRRGFLTSVQVTRRAAQSSRGRRPWRISGLYWASSSCASSTSLGWRGKESLETLQVLTAQEKKLRFSTRIFGSLVSLSLFLSFPGLF